ncbi:hypothetical protein [Alcaligenes sp. PF14]|uniref:hypothetical protein n=1 Tax=Alcaligenes sp. PF14 TaxID=3120297 RepID=UPI003018BFF7
MSTDLNIELFKNIESIKTDDSEMEFLVPNPGGGYIPVPYSYLSTHKEQRDTIIRLLRKSISQDMILALIEKAREAGKWAK